MKHIDFDISTSEVSPDTATGEVATRARAKSKDALVWTGVFAAIWWGLNPDDPASWIIGGPAILAASAVVVLIPRPTNAPISPAGAVRFAGFFAAQTVIGATDVALRAFNPMSRPEPGFLSWRTNLPEGAPRLLFANTITLLPGTLTAQLEGEVFTIHVLDTNTDATPQLAKLEARIAALFRFAKETDR